MRSDQSVATFFPVFILVTPEADPAAAGPSSRRNPCRFSSASAYAYAPGQSPCQLIAQIRAEDRLQLGRGYSRGLVENKGGIKIAEDPSL